jgi:hypothetical protein
MGTNSFVRVPPDSTGKRYYTLEHTVDANPVHVQVMHASDPDFPEYVQRVDERGAASVRFSEGSPLSDAFGNLKVSNRKCIGSYDFVADEAADLWSQEITAGGSITYMQQASTMSLAVGTALGDKAQMTTNHHHYYYPGTSNLYMFTVALSDTGMTGCRRRWGALDDHNGLFFKLREDNVLVVGQRSSVSGSPVTNWVAQPNWNGDKCDGTGLSGFTLDVSKLNIYWIDFQWLGAGRVRYGVIDEYGNRIVCHTMLNANRNQYPYMQMGTLTVRAEIENMAITGGAASMRLTCVSVHSEGEINYTYWRAVHEFPQASITGNGHHLISLKAPDLFNGKHNATTSYPEHLDCYVASGTIKLELYWDYLTLTGGTWTDNGTTVVANTTGTLTAPTGMYRPKTWYLDAGSHSIALHELFEKFDYGIDINADGTEPVYVTLVASKVSGTPTIEGGVQYAELR